MPNSSQAEKYALPNFSDVLPRIEEALGTRKGGEIAKKLGIRASSVSQWKSKNQLPALETLFRIAKLSNRSLHWLLSGEGAKFIEGNIGELMAINNEQEKEALLKRLFDDFDFHEIKKLARQNNRTIYAQFYMVFIAGMAVCVQRKDGIPYEDILVFFTQDEKAVICKLAEQMEGKIEMVVAGLAKSLLYSRTTEKGDLKLTTVLPSPDRVELDNRYYRAITQYCKKENVSYHDAIEILIGEGIKALGLLFEEPTRTQVEYLNAELHPVKVLGQIAAGKPVEWFERDEEEVIHVAITPELMNRKLFALRVVGDSMIDDGINPGDYIICYETTEVASGEIVVVRIEGEGDTVKRAIRDNGHVILQPGNKNLKSKKYEIGQVEIKGVVRAIQRKPE